LQAFAADLLEATKATIVADGLKDSRLINRITTRAAGSSITLLMPAYARWVIRGRSPFRRAGSPNTPPPYTAILEWVKYKRIRFRDKRGRFLTYASTAWAVRGAIAKRGIAPRDFAKTAIKAAREEASKVLPVRLNPILTAFYKDALTPKP